MALYDNKYWLLSHIRNSFISTDDTGMCELIMSGEEGVRKQLKQRFELYPDEEDSEDEDDLSQKSYDLQADMDFGIRHRSNTAARLEKLEQARRKTGRLKHVKWEMSKTPLSEDELQSMFARKEVNPLNANAPKPKSLLSQMFKQYTALPSNPFIEHAKFDGSGQVNVLTKKYRIFLTMLPEQQRNYPIQVCCIGTAKIQELVGLILLKCSTQYEDYHWKNINNYSLYITEEDGEVDRDFPCLDARENIAKFGFTCLGLVEHHEPVRGVSFDHLETVIVHRSMNNSFEGKSKGHQLKQDMEKQTSTDLQLMEVHNKKMEAPLYRSYRVYITSKMKAKVEINLGISADKIEIDPVQQNSKFAFVRQKAVNHPIDSIAWCEIVEVKNKTTIFSVIYSPKFGASCSYGAEPLTVMESASFKSYEFEADHNIATEIIQKVNLILDLRSSDLRKEYVAARECKQYKKELDSSSKTAVLY